jgi:hypothetical protein
MPVKRGVGRESRGGHEHSHDDFPANYGEAPIGGRVWPILPSVT